MRSKGVGIAAAVFFVATVYAANWAVTHWGIVGVGFGLTAPAAVYFVGIAFTLRDVVHRTLGRAAVIGAILAGAVLSYFVQANAHIPGGVFGIAVASGISFLVSETADLAVYEPVRNKGWLPAVVASNIVGIFADSLLFLYLAFGSLTFLWGQVVGKATMTGVAVGLLLMVQAIARSPKAVPA